MAVDVQKTGSMDLEDLNKFDGLVNEPKRVRYKNPDKKNATRRTVTHILSAEMLPPVTRQKVARYQVMNMYSDDPLLIGNPTGSKILPYDVIIPGTYMIHDRFENDLTRRDKMMRNVTRPGIEIKDGKQIQTEVVEDIILYNGFLEVNMETQYPLYVLMELHPGNKSNRRRPQNSTNIFYRTDLQSRSIASLDAAEDLAMEASLEVKEMEIDKVIGYAATLGLPTAGVQPGEVRYALRMFAKEKPLEFYKVRPDSMQSIKINFLDVLEFGFVEYDADKKGYGFLGPNDKKPFFVHAVGEEPVAAVCKYFYGEKGAEDYERILEYLNYWQ